MTSASSQKIKTPKVGHSCRQTDDLWLFNQLADIGQEDFQRRTTGAVGDHLNFVNYY